MSLAFVEIHTGFFRSIALDDANLTHVGKQKINFNDASCLSSQLTDVILCLFLAWFVDLVVR